MGEGSRLDDFDFNECLKYAPFEKGDVSEIIACWPGEADGEKWHYIVELKNKEYGYVTAWCDYSGWGCQEGGEGFKAKTIKEIFKKIENKEVRENLENQCSGNAPYALK